MTAIARIGEAVRRRRLAVSAAVVVLLAVAATVTVLAWPHDDGGDGLPQNAAFSYRGTVVTVTALQQRMHLLGALYGVEEPKGSAAQDKYWRAAAQADAMSLILDQAAAAEGVVVTTSKAEQLLQQMASSQLSSSSTSPSASLNALLKKFGVTKAQVLEEVKRQEEIALLFQKVTQKASATPSDADLRTYFRTHASDFAVAQKRHLLNIVVAKQSQAKALIAAARSTGFEQLARRYSLDDATRSKGGNLGTVAASALDAAYAKAAFAAPVGGVFGPVKTQYGWNVGKVVSVVAGHSVTFASVRKAVVYALQSNRAMAAWQTWLRAQIAQAGVHYASTYRPADPLQLPAVNLPTTQAP
jgi:peptidyl-prolyl cis-trans isomerase C